MSIVEMSKIKLYGLLSEKQKILNALFESRLVELKDVEEIVNTSVFYDETKLNELENQKSKLSRAIELILEKCKIEEKPENKIDITAEDFHKSVSLENKQKCEKVLSEIDELVSNLNELKKQKAINESKINQLTPFIEVKEKFSSFKPSKFVNFMLGTIPSQALKDFEEFLKDYPLTTFDKANSEGSIIKVYSHETESYVVVKKLNELGFSKVTFDYDDNAKNLISKFNSEIKEIEKQEKLTSNKFLNFANDLTLLKLNYDYLSFLIEKQQSNSKFRQTNQVFVLEGYLARKDELSLEKKLLKSGCSLEYEFSRPSENEIPPTITKNNAVVRQFEFVTNMYSAPHYRELDPNTVLAVFFSIFFGFIMADIGYGLCLTFFGFIMALKNKKKVGFKNLMNVVAIGGLFSIVFGVMFGSFFGLTNANWSVIPKAILPNPVDNVITMLVACLGAGIVQIMVSFVLKGILLVKRKKYFEAIFSAFIWDVFFVGLVLFALEFANVYKGLGTVGIILAGCSIAVTVIGTALTNKGFERLTKSFGALYGIINLFSDILSYARLFGLMLSGAIIGSIVNDLASGFLNSFSTIIIGAIILAIGHSFNLAMGALGAYIHVARLQYIEFFSRFYEGEGELFVPFGSNFSYINLIK